ncbi:nucleoside/nucleotide kinase family protein [Demequina pelophila]|uniref:nucleoside/nucleotide kinase family protein n=1 Tax=Demequina pelophila TaxID=1638984 RepID=UPI000785C374|nr:nucleoside/nucleotide kinase family protein [Demequina pelophila]
MRADGPPVAAVGALADRVLATLRRSGRHRIVIGITGSPGAGKSTLAHALADVLNRDRPGIAANVPMDGFHLANGTLDRLGIHDRKGAIDTFDGWGFLSLVRRIVAETDHVVYAPSFDRTVDEGVTGAIPVEPGARIVIVEGNYLLADTEPWNLVKDSLDEAWFCATDDDERLARLVPRHVEGGRSHEAAHAWAVGVDGANAIVIEASRPRADLILSGVTAEPVEA